MTDENMRRIQETLDAARALHAEQRTASTETVLTGVNHMAALILELSDQVDVLRRWSRSPTA